MTDDQIIEQVRRSIERRRTRPPEERWAELVRRGAIDPHGRVLLGTPKGRKPRAKRKAKTGT